MKLLPEAQGAIVGLIIVGVMMVALRVPAREVVEIMAISTVLVAFVILLVDWITR